MAHILKNKNLEIHIDLPGENYNLSRFDWTGKIVKVKFQNIYLLKFPFQLKPELFGETVNPEQKVDIGQKEIKFNGPPKEQFFFSNLTGGENVDAGWELINIKSKIAISETGSFQTNKVNLWGWGHVISPELFFSISVKSGQSIEWSRTYNVYKVK